MGMARDPVKFSSLAFIRSVVGAIVLAAGTGFSATAQSQSDTPVQSEIRVLAPVVSPAEQSAQVGGLSRAPIAETPQSITVLRSATLRDEGAGSLSAAIRSEPSVGNFYNTTGYIESLQIRGFLLDNLLNFRRDGMPVSNYAPAAFENRQSIEILKGVSGVQAGSSAPGGLVNYSLKRPTAAPLRELTVGLSERGTRLVHLDLGGRFGVDQALGYRFNAAFEDKRPIADNARGHREFVSGFFDFRLPARSLLEAEFEYQRSSQPSVPGFGLLDTTGSGVATTVPAPVNPRINLAAQPWAQPFEAKNLVASLRFSQTLANDWTWGARISRQNIRINDRLPFPDGCSSGANYVYPGFCGNGDFDLYDYRSDNERRNLSFADVYLRGEVKLGSTRHEFSAGMSHTQYAERFNPQQAYNLVGTGNQFTPVILPADPTPTSLNTQIDSRTNEIYLSDAIRFDDTWSLWLGLRHSRLDRYSERTNGSRATRYEQSFTTPWGALGYKPWTGGYAYVSAGSGVESEVVPNRPSLFTNAGSVLPALRSTQKEIGFKQTLAGGGLAHVAIFQINKPFSDDVVQSDGRALRVAGGREIQHPLPGTGASMRRRC
jgi:iron complex outermembrane recepter protein